MIHPIDEQLRDEARRFHLVYRGEMDPGTVNPLPEG